MTTSLAIAARWLAVSTKWQGSITRSTDAEIGSLAVASPDGRQQPNILGFFLGQKLAIFRLWLYNSRRSELACSLLSEAPDFDSKPRLL